MINNSNTKSKIKSKKSFNSFLGVTLKAII